MTTIKNGSDLEPHVVQALLQEIILAVHKLDSPSVYEIDAVLDLAISTMCIAAGTTDPGYGEALFESIRTHAERTGNPAWKTWRQIALRAYVETTAGSNGDEFV